MEFLNVFSLKKKEWKGGGKREDGGGENVKTKFFSETNTCSRIHRREREREFLESSFPVSFPARLTRIVESIQERERDSSGTKFSSETYSYSRIHPSERERESSGAKFSSEINTYSRFHPREREREYHQLIRQVYFSKQFRPEIP